MQSAEVFAKFGFILMFFIYLFIILFDDAYKIGLLP